MTNRTSTLDDRADLNAALREVAPLSAEESELANALFAQGLPPSQIVAAVKATRVEAIMRRVINSRKAALDQEQERRGDSDASRRDGHRPS